MNNKIYAIEIVKKPRINLTFLILIFTFAFCFGCGKAQPEGGKQENKANAESKADAPVSVMVGRAVSREIPSFIQATGSLIADETSDIAPKVAGKIVTTSVNVGGFVQHGSVVARIDDSDARLRLTEAQANVRQAEARLGLGANGRFDANAIPEVRAVNANYEQAAAELRQAEANEKRYRELVETGDVAVIAYEQFRIEKPRILNLKS